MAQLVRGNISDRPWGRTLAAFALRGVTGQLTLASDSKRFVVVFEQGAVVGAMSPLAADAAVRVALTAHLVSSSQVPEISRRQAQAPERDELDVIAELARLGPEHALRLRRRAIAQRAARTFSVNHGEFVVTDEIELTIIGGCALDARTIVYMGARANLAEQRLAAELAQLGTWFRLKTGIDDELPQFGFTDVEQPIIERLRDGGTLAQLEAFAASFVDARTVRAAVYALAVYNACDIDQAGRPAAAAPAPARPVATQSTPRVTPAVPVAAATVQPTMQPMPRAPATEPSRHRPSSGLPIGDPPRPAAPITPPRGVSSEPGPPRRAAQAPNLATGSMVIEPPEDYLAIPSQPERNRPQGTPNQASRTGSDAALRLPPDTAGRTGSDAALRLPPDTMSGAMGGGAGGAVAGAAGDARRVSGDAEPSLLVVRRRMVSSRPPVARQVARTDTARSHEVKALIAQRLKLLDQGADHFQLLGVSQDVTGDGLRRAYFALARQLHPDRLAALGIPDDGKHAQRLFAQINAGFAVLSDDARRASYVAVLRKGGEAAVRAEQARAEEMAQRILDAEEAFHRGELALRRDQPAVAVAELEIAIQLQPDEGEYHALLAWARFAAAPDKAAIAAATRSALDKAIQRAPNAIPARFYLGRVERMLGRDPEAVRHFREVLAAVPNHAEAAAELRALEARLGKGSKR